MKRETLFQILGEVDEQKVTAAGMTMTKRDSRPVWIKRTVVVAGLALLVVCAYFLLRNPVGFWNAPLTLFSYMNQLNLSAEEIEGPLFVSGFETPIITKQNLLNSMLNNTVVEGTIDNIECVRIQDNDTVWFVATMTISVDEVLFGSADSEVYIVCASKYHGDIADTTIPIPSIAGCNEKMKSVFVLSPLEGGSWNIFGKEVDPTYLGEYTVIYCLERNANALTYREQNITVNIDGLY